MCFSATASFTAAALTGAAGTVAVARAENPRDLPLATVPLFFAIQQALEGFLWLMLPIAPESAQSTCLTDGFLGFALVIWPAYAPLVAWLIEPDAKRKRMIFPLVVAGFGVAAYMSWSLWVGDQSASIVDGHIVYENNPGAPFSLGWVYMAATAGAPALSTIPAVNILSVLVLLGSVIAYVAYTESFVSVWCFFAAAASVVIVMHFERVRAAKRALAAGE
jgi:hypothetical protein